MNSTIRFITAALDKRFKDQDDFVIDGFLRHGKGVLVMLTVEHGGNKTGYTGYFKDRGERCVWLRATD